MNVKFHNLVCFPYFGRNTTSVYLLLTGILIKPAKITRAFIGFSLDANLSLN